MVNKYFTPKNSLSATVGGRLPEFQVNEPAVGVEAIPCQLRMPSLSQVRKQKYMIQAIQGSKAYDLVALR